MILELTPITMDRKAMEPYLQHGFARDVFEVYKEFYKKTGHQEPWLGYFVLQDEEVVGVGGYKGAPNNGKIEIAYGTVPEEEGKGIATRICKLLTEKALATDPGLEITARTLPEENASTSILRKNRFELLGTVEDPEDGMVWEWRFLKK